jgi:hypothetical protein
VRGNLLILLGLIILVLSTGPTLKLEPRLTVDEAEEAVSDSISLLPLSPSSSSS